MVGTIPNHIEMNTSENKENQSSGNRHKPKPNRADFAWGHLLFIRRHIQDPIYQTTAIITITIKDKIHEIKALTSAPMARASCIYALSQTLIVAFAKPNGRTP